MNVVSGSSQPNSMRRFARWESGTSPRSDTDVAARVKGMQKTTIRQDRFRRKGLSNLMFAEEAIADRLAAGQVDVEKARRRRNGAAPCHLRHDAQMPMAGGDGAEDESAGHVGDGAELFGVPDAIVVGVD